MKKIKERVEIGCYNLNSIQCFSEAQEYLKIDEEHELKIIYGVKAKFIDNGRAEENDINDIIILVKEQKGLKNLYNIVSNALANKPEGKNLIYRSQLDKYRDGLLYGTYGINGEVYKKLYDEKEDENLDEMIKFYDFIEIECICQVKNGPFYN